jgi:superfamily II DNA helicase RecQ
VQREKKFWKSRNVMKLNFFWIPARDSCNSEAELNTFLASHRIVQIEKSFVAGDDGPGWSICAQTLPKEVMSSAPVAKEKTGKIDYREVLDEESFRIYAILRAWRKEKAAEQGVPIYTVATNDQLAKISRDRVQTKSGLEQIEGFGPSRIGKYGQELVVLCQQTILKRSAPRAESSYAESGSIR